ncbi:MAG: hypothetical protein KKD38_03395, partial [Candidatus Delongbacteria bacterium]|nr:hypothetical protein [Candidatus Delongbacteria bacterium]MCG2759901.1 hypothetical protein [Candidatus Delongbacteria bacterium]
STGDKIDKKNISGFINGAINKNAVAPINYSKIKVNLYSFSEDSINYTKEEPEYSVGLSSDFKFELKNLSSGIYKMIAFNDINNDSKPQFESEMIGFTSEQVDLTDKDSLNCELTLGYNDTEPPFIKNTSIVENNIIKIEFSEELYKQDRLIDSLQLNNIPAKFTEYVSSDDKKNVYAKTEIFKIGDVVKIKLKDIKDQFGNMIKPNFRTKTHSVTDTIPVPFFKITGKLPNTIASDQKLAVSTSYFENDSLSIRLLDQKDSLITILYKVIILDPYKYTVDLRENEIVPNDYELQIVLGDSIIQKSKIIIKEETGYGQISGKIINAGSNDFVIICRSVTEGESKAELFKDAGYKIDLKPGKYLFALIADNDTDGIFSMNIFKNSIEKAVFLKDTILVRKNWETTDIDFKFKQ